MDVDVAVDLKVFGQARRLQHGRCIGTDQHRSAGLKNMVVIQHDPHDGVVLISVYAHNSILQVSAGDRVSAGQNIARVEQSGRATAPHLHFEIREGDNPKDPQQILPTR